MVALTRKIWRIFAVFAWFVAAVIWVSLTQRGSSRRAEAGTLRWTQRWARVSARIIGLRIVCHGDPDRAPGALVVSNHLGYLDVLVHASVFRLRFAPKIEMRRWPLIGYMTGLSRPVWIDRSSRARARETADAIVQVLKKPISMVVYAEGTSTDGEHGLLPFKSTAFEAAVEAGTPIQPTLLFYRPDPVSGGPVAWFGDDELLPHVWRVLGLKRIEAQVYLLDPVRPLPGEDRKALAVRCHDFMEQHYWSIKNGQTV